LAFWETYLGVRLEGAGVLDRIKVVFTLEAGGKKAGGGVEDREVWFELDLSRRDYDVKGLGGAVEVRDMGRVEKVLDRLNETRDIGQFLAGMRGLFLEEMKG
jgi:kinetochore protein Spc25, fungi type